MEKKLYMVETVSIFRHRYVVNAHEADHACDEVVMNLHKSDGFSEFSQKHIDENIISVREIDAKDYLETFDEDNDYLKDWTISQKMKFINDINYEDNE